MKKTFYIFSLIGVALVYIAATAIMLIALPNDWIGGGTFWLSYSLGLAIPMVFTIFYLLYAMLSTDKFIAKVSSFVTMFIMDIVLFVIGIIFCSIRSNTTTPQIIIYIVTYVVYFLVFGFGFVGGKMIKHNDEVVKEKVSFIRNLVVDIDVLQGKTENQVIVAAIKELSDEVRYSDPMSNNNVKSIEDDLTNKVKELGDNLAIKEQEELLNQIKEIRSLVALRNDKVKANK